MGNPVSKTSKGDPFDILREWESFIKRELEQVSGIQVVVPLEVSPCLRRSGFAQAGRSLSDRLTPVRLDRVGIGFARRF